MFLSRTLLAADHPYLFGRGGRITNNQAMQGLTLGSLRRHVALQPLALIMAAGVTFVAVYCARLASKSTDVNWSKSKDLGDHMGYYRNRQFKWINPGGHDYSALGAGRGEPSYREE